MFEIKSVIKVAIKIKIKFIIKSTLVKISFIVKGCAKVFGKCPEIEYNRKDEIRRVGLQQNRDPSDPVVFGKCPGPALAH